MNCKKRFCTYKSTKKYCSKKCQTEYNKNIKFIINPKDEWNRKEQICWYCKHSTGNCDWSATLKPIKGWVATRTQRIENGRIVRSYKIRKCPQFEQDVFERLI